VCTAIGSFLKELGVFQTNVKGLDGYDVSVVRPREGHAMFEFAFEPSGGVADVGIRRRDGALHQYRCGAALASWHRIARPRTTEALGIGMGA
jgi:hypothetical protein